METMDSKGPLKKLDTIVQEEINKQRQEEKNTQNLLDSEIIYKTSLYSKHHKKNKNKNSLLKDKDGGDKKIYKPEIHNSHKPNPHGGMNNLPTPINHHNGRMLNDRNGQSNNFLPRSINHYNRWILDDRNGQSDNFLPMQIYNRGILDDRNGQSDHCLPMPIYNRGIFDDRNGQSDNFERSNYYYPGEENNNPGIVSGKKQNSSYDFFLGESSGNNHTMAMDGFSLSSGQINPISYGLDQEYGEGSMFTLTENNNPWIINGNPNNPSNVFGEGKNVGQIFGDENNIPMDIFGEPLVYKENPMSADFYAIPEFDMSIHLDNKK
jgi:hypothetical protein